VTDAGAAALFVVEVVDAVYVVVGNAAITSTTGYTTGASVILSWKA